MVISMVRIIKIICLEHKWYNFIATPFMIIFFILLSRLECEIDKNDASQFFNRTSFF